MKYVDDYDKLELVKGLVYTLVVCTGSFFGGYHEKENVLFINYCYFL